jgi:pyruvate/2-oxoglutarate/acetoin dehydrogenase E1 component/TPP-dependent pyruvate/acetoin dehydrogenase alpha subunit
MTAQHWLSIARTMFTSRLMDIIEETELAPAGKITYQFSARGHELTQALVAHHLTHAHDGATVYYRSRPFVLGAGMTVRQGFAGPLGKATGRSAGRDIGVVHHLPQSMSICGVTVLPASGDVGTQFTPAVGWAEAAVYRAEVMHEQEWEGACAVAFAGDAATATSGFWSALVIATTQNLPVIFCIEDNGFGISVPSALQTPKGNIAANLRSFANLLVLDGSGSEPDEAARLTAEAVRNARARRSPVLLRLTVPRLCGHSGADNQSYKTREHLEEEQRRDPISAVREFLVRRKYCTPEELETLEQEIEQSVRSELALALADAEPLAEDARKHVFFDGKVPLVGGRMAEGETETSLIPAFSQREKEEEREEAITTSDEPTSSLEPSPRASRGRGQGEGEEERDDSTTTSDEPTSSLELSPRTSRGRGQGEGEEEREDNTTEPTSSLEPSPRASRGRGQGEGGERVNLIEAVRRVLDEELRTNPRLVVFGEDVGVKGGVHGATVDLQRKHGAKRVYDTSLSEEGIIGRSIGMALAGLMPVPEIQFRKYADPATEQLNDCGTIRWRTNGDYAAPVVVRIPVGCGKRTGDPWHSVSAEAVFAHSLGWKIAMPSNARDAAGLLRTALRGNDPTFFLEHRALLDTAQGRAAYPAASDFTLPFGVANCVREGGRATIVTWGEMVYRALEAAERVGGDVEVLDLRTIIPWDKDAIAQSVRKTSRCLVLHEDTHTAGFGGEIAAFVAQECFRSLDAPVQRVATADVPVPYNPILTDAVVPTVEVIAGRLEELLAF